MVKWAGRDKEILVTRGAQQQKKERTGEAEKSFNLNEIKGNIHALRHQLLWDLRQRKKGEKAFESYSVMLKRWERAEGKDQKHRLVTSLAKSAERRMEEKKKLLPPVSAHKLWIRSGRNTLVTKLSPNSSRSKGKRQKKSFSLDYGKLPSNESSTNGSLWN